MRPKVLVTGAAGLIGSETCVALGNNGYEVHGIDNNQREVFFGAAGDTTANSERLRRSLKHFVFHEFDIRDRARVLNLIASLRPQVLIHTAAQPSHDLAATIPFDDFDTNAVGTLNLLEGVRRAAPEAVFIHFSTNKVYGDGVNRLTLIEHETRWDFADAEYAHGIPEDFPVDHCMHSLFGVSKLAADFLVQEYGRYFGIQTCCLRGGCLTGPFHSGVELHGFLNYLVRCNIERKPYRIYGYKGKQVRDNIHAEDVTAFILEFLKKPQIAAVYNLGGGKENSCSILEALNIIESITGIPQEYEYDDRNRKGDHVCYYSDLRKTKTDYPGWELKWSLPRTVESIAQRWIEHQSIRG